MSEIEIKHCKSNVNTIYWFGSLPNPVYELTWAIKNNISKWPWPLTSEVIVTFGINLLKIQAWVLLGTIEAMYLHLFPIYGIRDFIGEMTFMTFKVMSEIEVKHWKSNTNTICWFGNLPKPVYQLAWAIKKQNYNMTLTFDLEVIVTFGINLLKIQVWVLLGTKEGI